MAPRTAAPLNTRTAEPARWGRRGTAGITIPRALTCEAIALAKDGVSILNGVTIHVPAGEVVALVGPSGCGKTTLLRVISGVEQATSGRLLMDGREIAGPAAFVPPEARMIGLVFQDYALFPHMSILDNVRFGLRAFAAEDRDAIALRALARVGLAKLAQEFPHRLSGGEQQRVALARAIAPRPSVLLMDEPFSNLDRRMRDSVREETMALLREMGTTAIIVTHDPEEAMSVADRIALMHEGRVVQAGTAHDIYTRPQSLFAARFFCDINEVPGIVQNGRAQTVVGIFDCPGLADGTPVSVCIRPELISLKPAGFCLPGRVEDIRFLGEVHRVDVAVPGLDAPLRARVRNATPAVINADVGVDIETQGVLVFPDMEPSTRG
ncbi:MAG: ABC transporter ATP-binding protein [Beijerinckiaceae bacterium]